MIALMLALCAQESSRSGEIDAWIAGLAHEDLAEREKAQASLEALADDLAYAVERLGTPADLEAKVRGKRSRRRMLDRLQRAVVSIGVGTAIADVRRRWRAGDHDDFEKSVRASFRTVEVTHVHYAAHYEIGDHLESRDNEAYERFKPLSRFGGMRDLLTAPVLEALNAGGVAIVEDDEQATVPAEFPASARCLIFTLPEGDAWSAYVVVSYRLR